MAEYLALEALYNSTQGEMWRWDPAPEETEWHFPSSLDAPCSDEWQGVTCVTIFVDRTCAVVELLLNARNLTG
jgi:hypothetical protein